MHIKQSTDKLNKLLMEWVWSWKWRSEQTTEPQCIHLCVDGIALRGWEVAKAGRGGGSDDKKGTANARGSPSITANTPCATLCV